MTTKLALLVPPPLPVNINYDACQIVNNASQWHVLKGLKSSFTGVFHF
jgi:hypothetical protein